MGLNLMTGEWEPDDNGPPPQQAGSLGEQAQAPVIPSPPPPGGIDNLPLGDLPMAPGQSAPGEAPGAVQPSPLAPPAPGTPPAIPAVAPLPPPEPIPAGRVVSPAESANLGRIDQLDAGRVATAQDQGKISGAQASAKVEDADRQAAEHEQFMVERQRIADAADKQIQARTAQADADMAKYRSFGIKDPAAEDSFTTRILKALAIAGGAYASGMNGGPNQALGIIQAATKDNIDRQKAQQEKLLKIAEQSGADVTQARNERDDAMKQLDLKHSALLDGAALELKKQLARTGVPQAQLDANADVQKLQQDAALLRQKTLQSIREDETKLAHADIAALAKKRAKGSGGGGAGQAEAYSQFVAGAGALKPGDPVPPELAALGFKGGLKRNQIGAEIDRLRGSGAKAELLTNRDAAVKQRIDNTNAALEITGPNGETGVAKDVKSAATLNKSNVAFAQLKTRIQALADDIKQQGSRAITIDDMQRRNSLAASAAAAGRVYNGLGGTDASQRLEAEILGPNGTISHGLLTGANLGVVQHVLEEAEKSHADRQKVYLRGGGPAGGPQAAPQATARPQSAVPSSEKAAALQWAQSHRDDPRAAKILQALGQ